ncbi:hypothetical protein ACLQ3C_15720 [Gordonia sp. DT30]|uniref:hypothetical protein n=1 Tax=unclassified Gordonia (in: high G+C Gram-positive bacteria) TaxID=2657482 RepID=UPI003CF22373
MTDDTTPSPALSAELAGIVDQLAGHTISADLTAGEAIAAMQQLAILYNKVDHLIATLADELGQPTDIPPR